MAVLHNWAAGRPPVTLSEVLPAVREKGRISAAKKG
jgi:hypothetical protein